MPDLTRTRRASLPDRAFAYIDSKGKRMLPINDEPHVRAALGRFGRVAFESEAARDRARKRLLTAAKRYGIVPVGFMEGQVASARAEAATRSTAHFPTGRVTFLLTDIEGSTALVGSLGERYGDVLDELRALIRSCVADVQGHEVDARADEFFAVFVEAGDALSAALAIQRRLSQATWPDGAVIRVRIGIHTGRPTLRKTGYVGLPVHAAARVSAVAKGGQVVLSGASIEAVGDGHAPGTTFRSLGKHRLRGIPEPVALYEVVTG